MLKATPGLHSLALVWEGGRNDMHFFVGPNPPEGFQPFHQHPPLAGVQCTQMPRLEPERPFCFQRRVFRLAINETILPKSILTIPGCSSDTACATTLMAPP
jgi:hypothetical protein